MITTYITLGLYVNTLHMLLLWVLSPYDAADVFNVRSLFDFAVILGIVGFAIIIWPIVLILDVFVIIAALHKG